MSPPNHRGMGLQTCKFKKLPRWWSLLSLNLRTKNTQPSLWNGTSVKEEALLLRCSLSFVTKQYMGPLSDNQVDKGLKGWDKVSLNECRCHQGRIRLLMKHCYRSWNSLGLATKRRTTATKGQKWYPIGTDKQPSNTGPWHLAIFPNGWTVYPIKHAMDAGYFFFWWATALK